MAAMLSSKTSSAAFATQKRAFSKTAIARPALASRRTVKVSAGAAPLVGSKAPEFKAQAVFDQEFQEVSLSKYKGKYVVLFF